MTKNDENKEDDEEVIRRNEQKKTEEEEGERIKIYEEEGGSPNTPYLAHQLWKCRSTDPCLPQYIITDPCLPQSCRRTEEVQLPACRVL